MSVVVRIPGPLRDRADGAASVVLERTPDTVRSALEGLFELHPGLRDRLLTEQGELRRHVALFVGPERVDHAAGLGTPIDDGAELTIVPAVSGGTIH